MTARIQKWGNSLAIRIPRLFAEEIGVREDSPIEFRIQDGSLVISPRATSEMTLEEMCARITEENCHTEVDWGPPVGREVW